MSVTIPNPTPLFHITSINNLSKILESGALLSKSLLDAEMRQYCNIAHSHIQQRRNNIAIPINKGGKLPDYVPFSFAPRSPMLDSIRRGNVASCQEPQENILHLVVYAQAIDKESLNYVFTTGHAIMQPLEFFDSLESINKVDWEILLEPPLLGGYAKYWNNKENPLKPKWIDRARIRQAEFLVHEKLSWHLIASVATMTEDKAIEVRAMLEKFDQIQPVRVMRNWYY